MVTLTREFKLKALFRLEGQPNVDFLGQTDGLCHISYQPDENTTLWVKLDALSTAALKQKYLDLKALLEDTLSITATVERKLALTEVTETACNGFHRPSNEQFRGRLRRGVCTL